MGRNTVSATLTSNSSVHRKILVARLDNSDIRLCSLDRSGNSLLPPRSANRHDAGCRGAGIDRVGFASKLTEHVWTIKELIEKAAEA